jgi:hypothetical protein
MDSMVVYIRTALIIKIVDKFNNGLQKFCKTKLYDMTIVTAYCGQLFRPF